MESVVARFSLVVNASFAAGGAAGGVRRDMHAEKAMGGASSSWALRVGHVVQVVIFAALRRRHGICAEDSSPL